MDEVEFLGKEIAAGCHFELTAGQRDAVSGIAGFLESPDLRRVYVLCGYAGTGKTSLVSALVRTMRALHRRVVLLAPTGRAAKVFSLYSGTPAYTVHRRIYRQRSLDRDVFSLDRNMYEDTLFIVDEASMISNELLDDLVSYVYSGQGCSMLLSGDTAQLPPVGESVSPALNHELLRSYGLTVTGCVIREVVRQSNGSGVLYNATLLRNALSQIRKGSAKGVFKPLTENFADVRKIRGDELVGLLSDCYSSEGIGDTIVLCRSNKHAIIYNKGIRSTILDREDELCRSDRLMIVKNNYYWTDRMAEEAMSAHEPMDSIPQFIANGDMAEVLRVRHVRELYGFRFADVVLRFPDYDDCEMEVTVLLDTLHSESPALTREQYDMLFKNVMEDYTYISDKRERLRKMREDPYYNAFQVKYAYAVTCHKAQGGQWANVFIDQGYIPDDTRDGDYYRWLYTAFTRATGTVYLVNWPE
ncbi:MAG: AAA family ATPase [Bacteroidaceae bacterium]|nr:AAA family ATPase [Bacteroidaceae bacterium]